MKAADVTYVGTMRSNTYRVAPLGTKMRFTRNEPVSFDDIDVIEWFEDQSAFDVEWTVWGELKRDATDNNISVQEAISDWSYRAKQRLATTLGVKGNLGEEEMERELKEEVERLQRRMEADR